MAKAMTVFLLLAATAAIAAASPMGKGFAGAVNVNGTAAAEASKSININFGHQGQDLSKCQCKDDCKSETRKVCKEVEKEEEVCKEVEGDEDVVVCETKCFKADKVISIGKGRRLSSANGLIAKAAILAHHASDSGNKTEGGQQQEICREICKDAKKPTKKEVCKKEKKTEYVDCKEEVLSTRCVKNCVCGEKTITLGGHGKGL